MTQWLAYYLDQNQHPQILFENSTVGTLSTDGQYVYVVEDLAVPPPQMVNVNMGFNPGMNNSPGYSTEIQDAVQHSRLQAFELKTNGKLTWELGTPEEKGPLSDCYFLGPPLPLAGKLYVLTEKQQELRLVCLDPAARGKVISTQTLGTSQDKMQNDVMRRTDAAHLAYGEGILVCPTNAGAVFGINLLENSLVWAYPYREKSDAQPQPHMSMRFGRPRGFRRLDRMDESSSRLRTTINGRSPPPSSPTARSSSPRPTPAPCTASTCATARASGRSPSSKTTCTWATSTTARC